MDAVDLPFNLTLNLIELFLERHNRMIPNHQDINITVGLHRVARIRAKDKCSLHPLGYIDHAAEPRFNSHGFLKYPFILPVQWIRRIHGMEPQIPARLATHQTHGLQLPEFLDKVSFIDPEQDGHLVDIETIMRIREKVGQYFPRDLRPQRYHGLAPIMLAVL